MSFTSQIGHGRGSRGSRVGFGGGNGFFHRRASTSPEQGPLGPRTRAHSLVEAPGSFFSGKQALAPALWGRKQLPKMPMRASLVQAC